MRWFLLSAALLATACTPPTESDLQLHQIAARDAVADARTAIARGDLRFVAIHGFSTEVPGVTLTERELNQDHRLIEGTSDFYTSPAELALNERAREYATQYNAEILAARSRR